jgi:radical SAM protein with 4Fe4S-binding SPASM domain
MANIAITPIQLHVTNACNLRCRHCYHESHSNVGALRFDDWKRIVAEASALCNAVGTQPLYIFAGGEPILCSFLPDLYSFACDLNSNARFALLTNGILLTAQNLARLPNDISIQVSIDGPDAASHDFQRGEGSFEKTVCGIKTALALGFEVQISTVLSTRTSQLVDSFFQLSSRLGVQGHNFTRLIPTGHGRALEASRDDVPLLGATLRDAFSAIIFSSKKWNVPTNTAQPLFNLLDPELGASGGFGFSVNVDHKGNLKPSARNDYIIGNVLEKSLAKLFLDDELMNSMREGNFTKCIGCPHRFRCSGDRNAAYAESGSFLASDPGCWC